MHAQSKDEFFRVTHVFTRIHSSECTLLLITGSSLSELQRGSGHLHFICERQWRQRQFASCTLRGWHDPTPP